ncbi:ferredoxin-thioredoxin reductase catalytic domain-containing protein [uncultured Methanomethylovorans sp.]|uniref:ferredoxin-thioredoxin reductase catalytic domain-containing protein n=1 Tax=uncultured Methanomethylovorans sp. TaxID=183759 RepID=UPI002AA72CC5|nr:ferredoxin-thioredoxin reductase catalytic domain-containing protein [uncultured Methanomethylovorans sp.]
MDADKRKQRLKEMFQRVVDPLGYKFSPDEEIVDFLLEQEVIIEKEHGHPFCPCQGLTGERELDMKIVCPCIPFHRAHFDAMKRCWCGLYVHKNVDDPYSLIQISRSEFEQMQTEGNV